jgi:hypothetical protein
MDGAHIDFTVAERTWLEQALKLLIRRAAEVAHSPGASASDHDGRSASTALEPCPPSSHCP